MTEPPLVKVTVQRPRRDAKGRWTLGDLYATDAESMSREDLYAAIDHVLAMPEECLRRVKGAHKR